MKHVVIIGGGIAGLTVASELINSNCKVTLIEKSNKLGGNLTNYSYLFPDFIEADKIINNLTEKIKKTNVRIIYQTEVYNIYRENDKYIIESTDNLKINADAVVVATGYNVFDATIKEEFGYKIYDNVITSVDLEKMIKAEKITTLSGSLPQRIAFIHCVGSRDAKVGNIYCSRVCCITAIKQAIEVKKLINNTEIFCFYIDLRLYGSTFDRLYLEAQRDYKVQFVRGRLSEVSEKIDKSLLIKAEDTLTGRPLQMHVDLIVLMAGIEPGHFSNYIKNRDLLTLDENNFFKVKNVHTGRNQVENNGIFLAGTCIGPMSVGETIDHSKASAIEVLNYLKLN